MRPSPIERVREAVKTEWSDERMRRVQQSVHTRIANDRRARVRTIALSSVAAAVAIAVVSVVVVLRKSSSSQSHETRVAQHAPALKPIVFDDGSLARPLLAETILHVTARDATRSTLQLVAGRARFEVRHNNARVFRVEAGDVAIQVLGTSFEVERQGNGARVSVTEGRVRVFYASKFADLGAGEGDVFPRTDPIAAIADAHTAPTAEQPVVNADAGVPTHAIPATHATRVHDAGAVTPTWRSLAHDGRYDEAWTSLQSAGTHAVRDEPAELLLASDVARLSGHPDRALSPLQQLLDHHSSDARAALAAFTLGRVLLDELGRPREAAAAFARAESLDPSGSLAEDALAREVEAWSRAGEHDRVHARGEAYLARFPEGRAARRVQRLIGTE